MAETSIVRVPAAELSSSIKESVLLGGDLERLKPEERVAYMLKVCDTLGLNPLTKPFEFLRLNGKMIMYARKDATEQLRKLHGVSVKIVARELVEDVYVVTAQASDKGGRCDESIGAVAVKGLQGEAKANALMKAETKAKRRVTLSISGLGMLDETEVEEPAQPPTPLADFKKANQPWMTPSPKAPSPPAQPATSGGAAPAENMPAIAPPAAIAPSENSETAASAESVPGDGEFPELVESWAWKWEAGRPPTKPERMAGTAKGEWVSIGMHPQRTKAQNAKLHALRAELGIDDDTWRTRLAANWNVESSADLNVEQARDLIDALEKRKAQYGTAADKKARQHRRVEAGAEEMRLALREPGEEADHDR